MPLWGATALSSLLFVAIHLPGWFLLSSFTLANAVSIFVLGVIFAVILTLSRSLWSSIVAHSLNDFFSAVLFVP